MINLAVITGAKSHNVVAFHRLFHSLENITSYIQHFDDFAASPEVVRDWYDAILFFFFFQDHPTDTELPGYSGQPKSALERLGKTKQGIIVLHHALLAFPGWPIWDAIVGSDKRELIHYKHDEKLNLFVQDHAHMITRGLADWTMTDETYLMADAGNDHHCLMKTDHPQSMKTIAWVHQHQASRVFCLQSGHDEQTWEDQNFRQLLQRGILWCARHEE